MLLSAGQADPTIDHRVVAVFERHDLVVDECGLGCGADLFQRCVGTPQCDVVANRCADQLRILEYETDGAIQFLGGDVAKIDAADADRSFGGIVKTGNQRGKRGFAGSG